MRFEGTSNIDDQFLNIEKNKQKLASGGKFEDKGGEQERKGIFQPFVVKFMQDIKSSFYNQS